MPLLSPFTAFAGFYGAIFLALGVLIPFWPLWLGHRGLSAEQIGLLLACASWARVAATPAVGYLSDRSGRPKAAILILAALSVAAFLLFPWTEGLWGLLLIQLLFTLTFHPLIPLGESQAMAAVRDGLIDYGRMRLWGSITFIGGSLGAGLLLTDHGPDLIIWAVVAALAATVLAAAALPRARAASSGPSTRIDLRQVGRLLAQPRFLLFLAAAGTLQASHATYYGFSALHWGAAGYSEAAIGWLWSEGVVAEILLFLAGAKLLARLQPTGLLAAAAGAGLLRWSLTALSTDLPVLVVAQSLHALTFGAAHLGAMHFLSATVPSALSGTAQALYAAISGGLLMGLAALASGWLFQADPSAAFGAMAALSAMALIGAAFLRRSAHTDRA